MAALERLWGSPAQYFAQHGMRAVSAEVRRVVPHPPSLRSCGLPLGVEVPIVGGERPSLLGLRQCRNRFIDPYCSGWFRQSLGEQSARVLESAMDDGWLAGMLVATVRHQDRSESLASVLGWAQSSWEKFSKRGAVARSEWAWLKVLDVVVGGRNGPHPHYNVLFLVRPWSGNRQTAGWSTSADFGLMLAREYQRAQVLWRQQERLVVTLSRGLRVYSIGRDPDGLTVGKAAAYASRHVEGSRKAAVEVTDDRHRRMRKERSGHTLMELACMLHSGQEGAGALLASSAEALTGRHSYSQSSGWRALAAQCGEEMIAEDADADAISSGRWVVGVMQAGTYRRHRPAVDQLLDSMAAESMGMEAQQRVWGDFGDRVGGVTMFEAPVAVEDWVSPSGAP